MQPATVAASGAPSIEVLETILDVTYTWGYQETRAKLRELYDKAVRAQWIADDVLPWHVDVDPERPIREMRRRHPVSDVRAGRRQRR